MTDGDLARYLQRLGLTDVGPATPQELARLQSAHLRALVFEGVEPLLGRTPSLSWPDLSAKLLDSGRGGYCFELNTAYGALLQRAGFSTRRSLARVRQRNPEPGARSHLTWLVDFDGETWVSDVGFGGPGPLWPLRLTGDEQTNPGGTYRLTRDIRTGEQVLERKDDDWSPLYSFDEAFVTDGDILAANHVTSTWSGSPFPSNLMVSGYDGEIRIGLFNRALSEEGPDGKTRSTLTGTADLYHVLVARLRLALDRADCAAIWARLPPDG